jgi:hypothetical protein
MVGLDRESLQEDSTSAIPRQDRAARHDALMDKYPNSTAILVERRACTRADSKPRVSIRRAHRLLFGTDFYDLTQKTFQQFDLFTTHKVDDGIRRNVSRLNASKLLKRV